ncbi:malto-oligosyltrehalose synthase [Sphingosinithalassobacter sp. LHW66-3]|uniref:malto-oligosyltrehalose synthase n=1 Tax=Sphingosinithalassobacter sp. LHW66-3 TaxID=3424718 RepID=UPI003D6BDAC8
MTPRATYRLQLHRDFGFADAEALVPYLDALGISHIYASPITMAAPGSMHGYDVADPTRISAELGGEAGFRSLVAALRARNMGIVIDIVPNHMGVAGGNNPWWNDVLRNGRNSRHASFFDIDWREKLLLPILGAPIDTVLAEGQIGVVEEGGEPVLRVYDSHRVPIRPEDHAAARVGASLRELLDRQHYRLGWWRQANDDLNWRRFFTINDLAGLRIEDSEVFEAAHALYFRLWGEGLIDGLRIDHVDGLTDPAGYCRQLRARIDSIPRPADAPQGSAWIVIEKILAPGEPLARDWGVDGTSGYDFMADVGALLHDPAGEAPLTRLWESISGESGSFEDAELRARQEMLSWSFEGQLRACVESFLALAKTAPETQGLTGGMLRRAIERALWVFPVYRTYGTGKAAPAADASVHDAVRRGAARFTPPGEAEVLERLLGWLAGEGPGDLARASEAVRRFQQLSAPVAAKSVEDTAFYRYGRLLSSNEVGSDPARFAMAPSAFADAMAERASSFPHAMLTTATHDHKRGEDVRARLAALSELPEEWGARVSVWEKASGGAQSGIAGADRYMLYQTLYGAWPSDLAPDDRAGCAAFAVRVNGWQEKALREAKLRSSWEAPDAAYEALCREWILTLLDPSRSAGFLSDLDQFVRHMMAPARANALVQAALRCMLPGVPDLYQGAELDDLSLVDPDNRRPVDYALRRAVLASPQHAACGDRKLRIIAQLLDLRRRHPELFATGDFVRLEAVGERAAHLFAFARTHEGVTLTGAVALYCARETGGGTALVPAPAWWGDTYLVTRSGERLAAAELFWDAPVFVSVES